MDFNLEYYRAFYFAARFGSISRAAEALYLSQPSVTRSVQKLEQNIGCRLFQRTARGMVLTPEGEILYRHVAGAFDSLRAGEQLVARLAEHETGELRIGTTESPMYQYLLPKLAEFQKQFPKIRIRLTGSHTPELWRELKAGRIDCAFVVSPLPQDMDCRCYPLGDIQDIFIAGPNFRTLAGREVPLEELMDYPITCVDQASSAGRHLADWFGARGLPFDPRFTVRTSTQVLPLVESGLSVGIIPEEFLGRCAPESGVFRVEVAESIAPRQACLALNYSQPMSSICREFVRMFLTGI